MTCLIKSWTCQQGPNDEILYVPVLFGSKETTGAEIPPNPSGFQHCGGVNEITQLPYLATCRRCLWFYHASVGELACIHGIAENTPSHFRMLLGLRDLFNRL